MNIEYAFVFGYPKTLEAYEFSAGATNFQKRSTTVTLDSSERIAELKRVLANSEGTEAPTTFLTVSAYEPLQAPDAPSCGEADDPRTITPSTVTEIGGIQVQKCAGYYMTGEPYYVFQLTRDNRIYFTIVVILHGEVGEMDVAEEILSTFRFVE